MTENFLYNIYGSQDSTDIDAVVYMDELPDVLEDRKNLTNEIKKSFGPEWNLILAKVNDGVIVDCTRFKSSFESLNNAIYHTYNLHKQAHPCMVMQKVKRNQILNIYRCVRVILTHLTRTHYRSVIRPTMNYRFGIDVKLNNLLQIDFTTINEFNQDNTADIDVWKILPFYLVQATALLSDVELYTKQGIVAFEPKSHDFIYRKDSLDKAWLTEYLHNYVNLIKALPIECNGEIITLHGEQANIKLEIPLI